MNESSNDLQWLLGLETSQWNVLETHKTMLYYMLSELDKELVNRKAFVETVTTLDHILPHQTVQVNLNLWKKPLVEEFDQVLDISMLDKYWNTMLHPSCLVQRLQDRKMLALHSEAQMQFNSLTLLW
jgi:hypothetical protein